MTIAFDTETEPFAPGRMAPPLACVTWATKAASGIFHWEDPALDEWLYDLFSGRFGLVLAHNTAYDTAVICSAYPELIPTIFDAYESGKIQDTLLNQQLIDIATGEIRGYQKKDGTWGKHQYGLDYTARRYFLGNKEKDEWQKLYGELRKLPLAKWPEDAKTYPINDAKLVLKIHEKQESIYPNIRTAGDQAAALFVLQLASVWGLKTSEASVAKIRSETVSELARLQQILVAQGLVREDGTRNTKAAGEYIGKIWEERGEKPRLTAKGGMSLDEESCLATEDPLLKAYAEFSTEKKTLSTDVPLLEEGCKTPIHTRFKLLETTRIGSVNPNVQNIRRKPGIRESFSPRPRWMFVDVDYPALELRTLAQVCMFWFGESRLGDVLNSGGDPHSDIGARILGIPYEEMVARVAAKDEEADNTRNAAKIANFGFPGGMQSKTLCKFAATSYGVDISEELAQKLFRHWVEAWPEIRSYFGKIRSSKDPYTNHYIIEHPGTGLIRSCSSFTNAANSPFQHLGAACAKNGLFRVSKACYADSKSILYGARPVNFIHDQIIVEIPYEEWGPERSSNAAFEIARLFTEGAKKYLPDIKISCKPLICERWSKKAKQTFNDKGLLIPWTLQ